MSGQRRGGPVAVAPVMIGKEHSSTVRRTRGGGRKPCEALTPGERIRTRSWRGRPRSGDSTDLLDVVSQRRALIASASGLGPGISPDYAALQLARVYG